LRPAALAPGCAACPAVYATCAVHNTRATRLSHNMQVRHVCHYTCLNLTSALHFLLQATILAAQPATQCGLCCAQHPNHHMLQQHASALCTVLHVLALPPAGRAPGCTACRAVWPAPLRCARCGAAMARARAQGLWRCWRWAGSGLKWCRKHWWRDHRWVHEL
jgi:hypothetical protein